MSVNKEHGKDKTIRNINERDVFSEQPYNEIQARTMEYEKIELCISLSLILTRKHIKF